MTGNINVLVADSLDGQTDGQNALLDLWVIKSGTHSVSLLICTLRNDFEGARKVVLQTRIFFRLEKSGSAKSDFFLVGEKWFCKIGFFSGWRPKKKPSLQNHFSASFKIISKGAD